MYESLRISQFSRNFEKYWDFIAPAHKEYDNSLVGGKIPSNLTSFAACPTNREREKERMLVQLEKKNSQGESLCFLCYFLSLAKKEQRHASYTHTHTHTHTHTRRISGHLKKPARPWHDVITDGNGCDSTVAFQIKDSA